MKEDRAYVAEKLIIKENSTAIKEINHQPGGNVFYLKGLNGLRAIAALCVVLQHIMHVYKIEHLDKLGECSVTIFFTLSGFLITFLLLKEIDKTKTVSVRKFYIRRILRIWPLYFFYLSLVLCANYFVFSSTQNFSQIFYYIFFLPNVPTALLKSGINMSEHYWSLGVEEQFYFVWPLILKTFSNKLLHFCIAFIGIFLVLKFAAHLAYGGDAVAYRFFYFGRFDCMALGGIGAFLHYKKFPFLPVLNNIFFQIPAWSVLLLLFFDAFNISGIIDHEIMALVTLILISNQIANPKSIIKLENKVLDHLGKISFGIYIYHPLIIGLMLYAFKQFNWSIYGYSYIILPFLVIAFTILIAHISYTYFESRFLKLKQNFAIVKSANSAKAA